MVVLRNIDFETGDFSQNIQFVAGDTTLVSPGLTGNYAALCTSGIGSVGAADLRIWSFDPVNLYPDLYFAFKMKVQDGFIVPAGPQWQLIFEINAPHPVSANEHLAILFMGENSIINNVVLQFYSAYYAGHEYDLPYEWGLIPTPGVGPNRSYATLSNVEMPTGKTVQFEFYIKTHLTDGIIRIKMNGVIIIEYHGRTQFDPQLNPDTGQMHDLFSTVFGNYCDMTLPLHGITFDDIYIGTESITPTPPYALPQLRNMLYQYIPNIYNRIDEWKLRRG